MLVLCCVVLMARDMHHVMRFFSLSQVRAMIVTCPQLLLNDVRNVVVPSLQYMLQSTSDHDELAKRLFRDPSLLVVGVGPLARLQYTLEQHRNGTASAFIAAGHLAACVGPEASETSTAAYFDTQWVGAGSKSMAETGPGRKKGQRKGKGKDTNGMDTAMSMSMSTGDLSLAVEEDQTRLLPPVIVPQVIQTFVRCETIFLLCSFACC